MLHLDDNYNYSALYFIHTLLFYNLKALDFQYTIMHVNSNGTSQWLRCHSRLEIQKHDHTWEHEQYRMQYNRYYPCSHVGSYVKSSRMGGQNSTLFTTVQYIILSAHFSFADRYVWALTVMPYNALNNRTVMATESKDECFYRADGPHCTRTMADINSDLQIIFQFPQASFIYTLVSILRLHFVNWRNLQTNLIKRHFHTESLRQKRCLV